MILFVITDSSGVKSVSESTLKKLSYQHDVFVISIGDATLTNGNSFDNDNSKYIPEYISNNSELMKMELEMRQKIDLENEKKLLKYKIMSTKIDADEEIVGKVIELLGGHKNANNR